MNLEYVTFERGEEILELVSEMGTVGLDGEEENVNNSSHGSEEND